MTRNVIVVHKDETLGQVAKKLVEHKISGAPVVDSEGNVVGIISESDLLKHLKCLVNRRVGMRYLSDVAHSLSLFTLLARRSSDISREVFSKLRESKAEEAMTKHVISASPNETLEEAAALMIKNNIDRIPIIEGKKVVGIVTRRDIARFVAERRV